MNRLFTAALLAACTIACGSEPEPQKPHPDWTYNSVVYQMNLRAQSPEGTFSAAQVRLPVLCELGVDILALMPIHPIGVEGRKGGLGSPYAVKDFYAINPDLGTMADFERFLQSAHDQGLRVVLDIPAGYTSPDAAWAAENPLWYVRDSTGKAVVEYDWTDLARLDYSNPEVCKAMSDVLAFWTQKGVDGFRIGLAEHIPDIFWQQTLPQLRALNPDLYLLADNENIQSYADGFDADTARGLHHLLNAVARGDKTAADIREWIEGGKEYPREAFRVMFISDHDENAWAGTEFERLGDAVAAMAALTYVLPQGQPMIYAGQEVGFNRRLEAYEKDFIENWEPNEWTQLYTRLNALRHHNPALAVGERGGELIYMTGVVTDVLAFTREVEGNKVFCLFNLSDAPSQVIYTVAAGGDWTDALTADRVTIAPGSETTLAPWEYRIYTKNL